MISSIWNAGPRDVNGHAGPYEAALEGHALHDPEQGVEIRRTIHRVDSGIACAAHSTDEKVEELFRVKVRRIIGGTLKAYREILVSPVI